MSAVTDMSFLDIMLEKEDVNKSLNSDPFVANVKVEDDDFLNSLLFNQNFDFLQDTSLNDDPVNELISSGSSDSGISSNGQEMSSPLSESYNIDDSIIPGDMLDIDSSFIDILNNDHSTNMIPNLPAEETREITRPVVVVKPQRKISKTEVIETDVDVEVSDNEQQNHLVHNQILPDKIRNVKIVKANGSKYGRTFKLKVESRRSSTSSEDNSCNYLKLGITEEEKRLMEKEGYEIPNRLPLTKEEERNLKRVRRKIRNKISAQDSRKRKKEYVEGLELRVKQCSNQNSSLLQRVQKLQTHNKNLEVQIRRLKLQFLARQKQQQSSETSSSSTNLNGSNNVNQSSATTMMVFMLLLALLTSSNMRSNKSDWRSLIPGGFSLLSDNIRQQLEGFMELPYEEIATLPLTLDKNELVKPTIKTELADMLIFHNNRAKPSVFSSYQDDHDYLPLMQDSGFSGPGGHVKRKLDTDEDWFTPPKRPPKTVKKEADECFSNDKYWAEHEINLD